MTDIEAPHIAALPQVLPGLFAAAAQRAEAAGFDGVELHYAHAYTMASFLSALNTRPDGYGGARENRVRLPLEVYRAVRQRFRRALRWDAGSSPRNASRAATAMDGRGLVRRASSPQAGMDFLSLSRGGKFEDAMQPKVGEAAYPYTGPSGYECMPQYISDARGPLWPQSSLRPGRCARQCVAAGCETPVVTAGGVHGFAMAEDMLENGEADIVASARQSLADPDWFLQGPARARGRKCGPASSPTIAKGSTRSTSR